MTIVSIAARNRLAVRFLVAAWLACAVGIGVVHAGPCSQVSLPPGWFCEAVGNPLLATDARATSAGVPPNQAFTIRGGGNASADFSRGAEGELHLSSGPLVPGDTSDSFVFVYRPWSGDFEFTARLTGTSGSIGLPIAGLMVRERVGGGGVPTEDARHVSVLKGESPLPPPADPNVIVSAADIRIPCVERFRRVQDEHTRYLGGGNAEPQNPGATSTRLRLVRQADQVSLYCKRGDGTASPWTSVGGTTLKDLGVSQSIDVGFAVTVHNYDGSTSKYGQAVFDEIYLRSLWTRESSWMANSLPGGGARAPFQVSALYVDPDGTSYTNRRYFGEEGWLLVMIDPNGKFPGEPPDVRRFDYASAYGLWGGHAITATGQYVYVAQAVNNDHCFNFLPCPSPIPPRRQVIRRYVKSGLPSPLSNGQGWDLSMRLADPSNPTAPVRGLAIDEPSSLVYASVGNHIRAYDLDLAPFPPAEDNSIQFFATPPLELAYSSGTELSPDPSLWVIQSGSQRTIHKLNLITKVVDCTFAGVPGWMPTALAVHPQGFEVWVADDGPAQNIKKLRSNNCTLKTGPGSTFGDQGGIYGGTKGQVAPKKFNGPVGIGFDSSGNIYVASNGPASSALGPVPSGEEDGTGAEIRSFESDGDLRWELYGLEAEHAPDDDPGSSPPGSVLYSATKRYVMDYTKPSGNELGKYSGLTVDRFRLALTPGGETKSHDGRLWPDSQFGGATIRRLGLSNERIMFVSGQSPEYLGIYRFDPSSEIAIPSGLLMSQCKNHYPNWHAECNDPNLPDPNASIAYNEAIWPFTPQWQPGSNTCKIGNVPCSEQGNRSLWIDDNGDGAIQLGEWDQDGDTGPITSWYVDETGDIWATSPGASAILRYDFDPLNGLNVHGVPVYGPPILGSAPAEFTGCPKCLVQRSFYIPSTDTMYLSGFTQAAERDDNDGENGAGTRLYRYNNWSTTSRTLAWGAPIVLPYGSYPPGAGNFFNIATSFEVRGDRLYVSIAQPPEVRVYDAATGNPLVGENRTPGPEVAGKGGGLNAARSMQVIAAVEPDTARIAAGELLSSKTLLYDVCTSAAQDSDMDGVHNTCDTCPTIYNPSQAAVENPTVTVTNPNMGGIVTIGTATTLTWSATDTCGGVSDVSLLISRNGVNGQYTPIGTGISNSGSYPWTVTGPTTNGPTAFLKVVARDPAGSTTSDTSNQGFTISYQCNGQCQTTYCGEVGVRCNWVHCTAGGCCNYTCVSDPSCTAAACPPNACACGEN